MAAQISLHTLVSFVLKPRRTRAVPKLSLLGIALFVHNVRNSRELYSSLCLSYDDSYYSCSVTPNKSDKFFIWNSFLNDFRPEYYKRSYAIINWGQTDVHKWRLQIFSSYLPFVHMLYMCLILCFYALRRRL